MLRTEAAPQPKASLDFVPLTLCHLPPSRSHSPGCIKPSFQDNFSRSLGELYRLAHEGQAAWLSALAMATVSQPTPVTWGDA